MGAGKLGDDVFYHALIGNGFNSTDRGPNDVDDRFVYSISSWWEPLGEVGKSHSDLKYHKHPVVRLGHSFTYASQGSRQDGTPHSEITFVRISDGTRLVTPEALAPGVSVNEYDIYLYSIDAAWKRCGFSFNTEYFLRWINEIKTTGGPSPYSQLFAHGFYFDVGYFLLPKKLEVAGQVSYVSGEFGDSWEYAAGVNYFVQPSQFNKFTFDVTVLDGSPTASTSPNYFVGQSGCHVPRAVPNSILKRKRSGHSSRSQVGQCVVGEPLLGTHSTHSPKLPALPVDSLYSLNLNKPA